MTGAWTLDARDVVPDTRPRRQTCPTCKLVYQRLRLEKVAPDSCPMCAWVELRREEAARRAASALNGSETLTDQKMGIGAHIHHTVPHSRAGHTGTLIPLCALCHQVITPIQQRVPDAFRELVNLRMEIDHPDDIEGAP